MEIITLTNEEKAALRTADPSAFDLESSNEEAKKDDASTSGADDGAGSKAEGEADAVASEGLPDEDASGAVDKKPVMIPKARFDEAVQAEREKALELARRLDEVEAKLNRAPAVIEDVDFAAKKKELAEKYDNGDIDSIEYQDQRDALVIAQAKYESRREENERRTADQVAAEANSWQTDMRAWQDANADFLADPVNADDMKRALEIIGAAEPNLSNKELIEKAEKSAFTRARYERPNAPANPRDVSDAAAAAAASALPGLGNGGQGERSNIGTASVDLVNMKAGTFGLLSKAQRAELLGGAAAL